MRAAVVGAGFVGAIHARALRDHPSVDLVAVCGRTAPKAEKLASAYGVAVRSSVEDLMHQDAPDVVCICTGNDQHLEPTLESLEGGAHVFVEKPMAFRLDQARRMIEASNSVERSLGVDLNHRFSEPYRRALGFAAEGGLGDIAYIDMKFAGANSSGRCNNDFKSISRRLVTECLARARVETQSHRVKVSLTVA